MTLVMEGIHKSFGATVALAGVDLQVSPGEVCALVGENGAGKSTLMKVLSGAHSPDAGSMTLSGAPYKPRHPLDGRRRGVAMIYQELSLALHLSVAENILLGMEPRWGPFVRHRELEARARQALQRVGLDVDPKTPVALLSIGERQRVEIARAVAQGFEVLVLDEPTSSLGQHEIEHLFQLIADLRTSGHAIVYISHFLEEVMAVADRYIVLRDGRSVASGSIADTDPSALAYAMVGRSVEDLYPRSQRQRGERLLTMRSVEGRELPRNARLEVHRGEIVGVAGLVGAGRTELLRTLFGLDLARGGEVELAGEGGSPVRGFFLPHRRWQQGVGLVSEDRKEEGLALNLSVSANLTLSDLRQLECERIPWIWPARERRVAAKWIAELGIRCRDPEQRILALSGGNQQKVALARLLYHDVELLLLDEPTRGIDVGSKAQIYELLDTLAARGKGIVMVSSYLPELLGVCDRIVVMHRGETRESLSAREADEHTVMLLATGGNAAEHSE